jgi:hypothetical protein
MPGTLLLYLNYPHPLQVIRDRKFIVPINIRFERQSGRRRFSSGCLFLAQSGHIGLMNDVCFRG